MANITRYTKRLSPGSVRAPGYSADWWPENQCVIRELIEYSDVTDNAATVTIGTIPAGASYVMATATTITAFNSGGSDDAVVVGISGDTDYLIEDCHPMVADSQTEGELKDWTPTSDTIIYATHSSSGTAPTAGKIVVEIAYKRPL